VSTLARLQRVRELEREGADRAALARASELRRAEHALAQVEALLASDSSARPDRDRPGRDLAADAHARNRLETARAMLTLGAARAARQTADSYTVSRMARARQDSVAATLFERERVSQARANARSLEATPNLARGLLRMDVISGPTK
jgi:hypothetical protein